MLPIVTVPRAPSTMVYPLVEPIFPLRVISPSFVAASVVLMVKLSIAVSAVAPIFPVIVTLPVPETIVKLSAVPVLPEVSTPLSVESNWTLPSAVA